MLAFVARRGIGMLVSTILVITITFILMQLVPGDPASVMLGANATPEQIEQLRSSWGLDQPVLVQFYRYFTNFFRGDLGSSLFHQEPVLRIIKQRAETSILLGLMALLVVVGIGIPGGVFSAPVSYTHLRAHET